MIIVDNYMQHNTYITIVSFLSRFSSNLEFPRNSKFHKNLQKMSWYIYRLVHYKLQYGVFINCTCPKGWWRAVYVGASFQSQYFLPHCSLVSEKCMYAWSNKYIAVVISGNYGTLNEEDI